MKMLGVYLVNEDIPQNRREILFKLTTYFQENPSQALVFNEKRSIFLLKIYGIKKEDFDYFKSEILGKLSREIKTEVECVIEAANNTVGAEKDAAESKTENANNEEGEEDEFEEAG